MADDNSLLLVSPEKAKDLMASVAGLPMADLDKRQLCNLELLMTRAFAPLDGFMGQKDYQSVLKNMRLENGRFWPMPICLDVSEKIAGALDPGGQLALSDQEGFVLAVMTVADVWQPDKAAEARAVFGTDDPAVHPGVKQLFDETRPWYVGGQIQGVSLPRHYDALDLRKTPAQTRELFQRKGWQQIMGVHAEKPLHKSDLESLLEVAEHLKVKLFIQPAADQPAMVEDSHFTRVRCYRAFMEHVPSGLGELGLLSLAARFAGPREALLQAVVRKNFGCTHLFIAPDHADPFAENGQDRYFRRFEALEAVKTHAEEIGIVPVQGQCMVYHSGARAYVPEEQAMGEAETLPEHELLRRLEMELPIPKWFTFPEVLEVLRQAHPPRRKQGFTVFITGLSGAGKSTLAKILYVKFMQDGKRPVTLLDGDIVRKNLSKELNFSREHRNINVERIGFVASQITKNRGIAICAPIAPYEASRQYNREQISKYGGYIEVYMSTPLELCEERDVKGLYAKARAGLKKGVTGIDDPYELPESADLVLDTSNMSPTETAQRVLVHLREKGYLG